MTFKALPASENMSMLLAEKVMGLPPYNFLLDLPIRCVV